MLNVDMPRKSTLKMFFHGICGRGNPCNRSATSRGRRSLQRNVDVEQDKFQYASDQCLSSFYSVFVARLTIMVMLAILIGLLTILTWHFTRVYTTKSINSLAYGLRYELLQRPILRMWNILNSTVEITTAQVKLSEYVFKKYDKQPASQAEQVELYQVMRDVTWALFASRKALNAITISYRNGFVQAFHRDHRSDNTFYIYSDLVNYSIGGSSKTSTLSREGWNDQAIHNNITAIWYREPLDPTTGEKIGKARPIPPDDLINIAGLSQVPDGMASWHVAVSKFTGSPLLSAALPVWDPSNESIVAVVGVTTALYSVGQLMKELVGYHSGHIYLTSQEGYLIATSTNAPLLTNSSGKPKLVMAANSQNRIIRLGAEWLQKHCGKNFAPTHEVHVDNAKLDDKEYYIDSFFLNLKRLPMVGVLIIPRKYIMGKADERAFKTFVILISASLCILVIGCFCILILTNGVSKEMKLRAELISHLDARRKAEASSNYKSQFLANMSHELRTPMAGVIGLLDILISDDCLTTEQHDTVNQIRKCSTALLRLLNNILDLSKVESGKLVLEEAEFDLGKELEGLIDVFSVQCINHNVETVLDISDDMPRLVQGDSARIVQIFSNLISNSIKFTTSGHIILRGWCEILSASTNKEKFPASTKNSLAVLKTMLKQHGHHARRSCKKENKVVLWFEVDDTGCGIDPSKWESVFESFEQADPSTTRTHGGTGLGLCIVRTLVNKMGGEIKVVRKNGPGTLMRLYLLLNSPVGAAGQNYPVHCGDHSIAVLLALNGDMGRSIMSSWLRKHGAVAIEASEWNELTQILSEIFQTKSAVPCYDQGSESLRMKGIKLQEMRSSLLIIVVDIALLDLRTDIWKEQLNFLSRYSEKAKFVWMLNHDTSNAVKMELRRKGHCLMINKPLYKVKMNQILESFLKERDQELQKETQNENAASAMKEEELHECLEIDSVHPESASSDDSDKSDVGTSDFTNGRSTEPYPDEHTTSSYTSVELSPLYSKNCVVTTEDVGQLRHSEEHIKDAKTSLASPERSSNLRKIECKKFDCWEPHLEKGLDKKKAMHPMQTVDERRSLEGLCILLAEDTPVLQRVATIMLEKMGATVIVVADGIQAVDALRSMLNAEDSRGRSLVQDKRYQTSKALKYDLILMDCQMPKMDGYEATKAIRESEAGTGSHIPIVALTAHAMSSDEAKCLEVGMDAYLTKPIDCKLMVSTILSLTSRTLDLTSTS